MQLSVEKERIPFSDWLEVELYLSDLEEWKEKTGGFDPIKTMQSSE